MLFVFWAGFFYQHFWDIVTFWQLRQRHEETWSCFSIGRPTGMGKSELDQPTGTLWAHSSHWSQRKDVDIWGTQQHFQQLELLLRKVPGVNLFTFQLELCSSNSPAVWLSLISNGVFIFIQRWTALDPRIVFLYDGSSRTSALLSLSRSAKATWMMYTTCTPRLRMIWECLMRTVIYLFMYATHLWATHFGGTAKGQGPCPQDG